MRSISYSEGKNRGIPMLLFLLAAASTLIGQRLDYDMSADEKKKTGVTRLSPKEKAALQNWIDAHYEKRSQPLQQTAEEGAMLQENLKSGQYVRLTNGSLWNIHPQDTSITQAWITPVDITVTQSGDPNY